eukprot:gene9095-6388_t
MGGAYSSPNERKNSFDEDATKNTIASKRNEKGGGCYGAYDDVAEKDAATGEKKTEKEDNGGCCGSPDDVAENDPVVIPEVEAEQQVEMRENRDSVDEILHFPDDSQQICVLQHMQGNLKKELELYTSVSAAPEMSYMDPYAPRPVSTGAVPSAASQPSPSLLHIPPAPVQQVPIQQVNVELLQRQIQLYNQLISLVQQQQQELAKVSPSGITSNLSTGRPYQPVPTPAPMVTPVPIQYVNPTPVAAPATTPTPSQASVAARAQPVPMAPEPQSQPVLVPVLNPNNFVEGAGNDPRREAYQSMIVESDSNALARLLKKHFNNFVLECEFNASGNTQAYDIIRSRRCDQLEIDSAYSSIHNLTIDKTKTVADLFLRYCMAVIDAQHWGGELRYVIKRPSTSEGGGSIFINGSVSYLSADKLMKLDAPYHLEVDFILVQEM